MKLAGDPPPIVIVALKNESGKPLQLLGLRSFGRQAHSELMIANNVHYLVCGASAQGIGAKACRPTLRKSSIDFSFIRHEIPPEAFLQPRHIPGDAQTFVTGVEASLFLFDPLSKYAITIKVSTAQVPVAAIQNLNLARIEVSAQMRCYVPQSGFRSSHARRLGR